MNRYDITTGRGIFTIPADSAADARRVFRARVSRDAILRVDVNRGTVQVPLFR